MEYFISYRAFVGNITSSVCICQANPLLRADSEWCIVCGADGGNPLAAPGGGGEGGGGFSGGGGGGGETTTPGPPGIVEADKAVEQPEYPPCMCLEPLCANPVEFRHQKECWTSILNAP